MRTYSLTVPDEEYYRKVVRCKNACPVGTDAQGYLEAIAHGEDEKAFWIARANNPLASTCGRICGAHCEAACRRGALDAPAAIRALKGYVAAQYGVEAGGDYVAQVKARRPPAPPTGKRVAIVGSGPAGLGAAHDLCLLGHAVEIFEAADVAGGMMALGIPRYRLSRALLAKEVAAICALGVRLRLGVCVGKDVPFEQLRREFDAVLIATGLPKGRMLPLPGADHPRVLSGMAFLRSANLGEPVQLGRQAIVVGGGNVAMDVARTALRLGAIRVTCVCLESRAEMPASALEIEEAEQEGIRMVPGWGPKAVALELGAIVGLDTVRCTAVFDRDGRFAPTFDEGTRARLDGDTIFFAVGQAPDLGFLGPAAGVETNPRGVKIVDGDRLTTTAERVHVAGDLAHGPRLLIDAVASGQKAARAIHEELMRATRSVKVTLRAHVVAPEELPSFRPSQGRCEPPALDPAARRGSLDALVEQSYARQVARWQANRCLRCNLNTIFRSDLCVLCGGCVDVCPESCLKIIPAARALATPEVRAALERLAGRTLEEVVDARSHALMIKDEEVCIRCGLCALRCPTHAITLERIVVTREESYVATGA